MLHFGLKGFTPVQYYVTSDNDTANPQATRVKISSDKMIEKRRADAKTESTSAKVRKWKNINARIKEYTISSSLEYKKKYLLTIYNVPWCSCPDFKKRRSQVLCKHIIFVFLYIL